LAYDMVHFSNMLRDRRRRAAYVEALRRTVGPDSVVLDLGSGPGFFAAVAARLGARSVYAVDLLESVDAVPALARANGLEDRITAFRGDIRSVELPEAPDIVIADLRGALPLLTSGLSLAAEVQETVMAPGGTWLQERDDLRVALAYVDRVDLEAAWDEPGFDFDALRRHALSVPRRVQLKPNEVLTSSATWEQVNYRDVDDLRRHRWRGEAEVTATEACVANTVALWFDATLIEGIAFTSAPGDTYTTYGQIALPFVEPLTLAAGETATVGVKFDRLESGNVWRWTVDTSSEHREGDSLAAVPLLVPALAR
jgi:SAM-dependent methyltransferase